MAGHEATKEVLDDQEGIMHACEGETSMMMALKPDLVDHARLPEAHGPNLGPSPYFRIRLLKRPESRFLGVVSI